MPTFGAAPRAPAAGIIGNVEYKKQNNLIEPGLTLMFDDLQRFLEFRFCIDLYEMFFFACDIFNYASCWEPNMTANVLQERPSCRHPIGRKCFCGCTRCWLGSQSLGSSWLTLWCRSWIGLLHRRSLAHRAEVWDSKVNIISHLVDRILNESFLSGRMPKHENKLVMST